ncbi:glycosyltransferase family 4 protein [Pseudidiomarina sp. 1APR75-33.1]|uniref:glycosyltransferase family 4 protein n=1 Tax=Pseudidiomarina terrestris TaxID=2820060 RepID=UPI00264FB605|nr:glycosyltransferase family 4 protein [Pseudidiomarina sp. 1APR75-33.1]MDN7126940.1 glycosyltransferase family 4 protein [Pseudidiomarina sp. 1APR75-33.1]
MQKKNTNVDIIILSRLGSSEGGRESWIYNFLPLYVDQSKHNFCLIGYRFNDESYDSSSFDQRFQSVQNKIKAEVLSSNRGKLPKFIYMRQELKRFLAQRNEKKVEILVCMGIFELFITASLKQYKSAKKVVWLRGIFLHEKFYSIPRFLHPFFRWVEGRLLRSCDVVVSNGSDIKSYYQSLYGIDVEVIENGIDIRRWKNKSIENSKNLKVAYIGRLSREKGLDFFLEMVERAKQLPFGEDIEFHIAGSGEYLSSKVQKFSELGWVTYHGTVHNEDMVEFLQEIDVCVAFTLAGDELGGGGTSNALFEQMACEKIILAWDNKIFRQVLTRSNSFLVNEGSIVDLIQQLEYIFHYRATSISRGKKARETVSIFSMESQIEKLKHVLED